MHKKDSRMAERFGIDPILEQSLDSQDFRSVENAEDFLRKWWKTKGCLVSIKCHNKRAYVPQVKKTPATIFFIVCDKKHPSDFNLQLAIAILKSIRGDYDELPNLNASDDKLIDGRPRPINAQEAQEGKDFLKWLSKKE